MAQHFYALTRKNTTTCRVTTARDGWLALHSLHTLTTPSASGGGCSVRVQGGFGVGAEGGRAKCWAVARGMRLAVQRMMMRAGQAAELGPFTHLNNCQKTTRD